ncbi:MAG: hypothetical protein Q9178_003701 [Gyalolechia marmorata]
MTEPSYGSPSRFIGKSPNPRHQPSNRPHRPVDLAFVSIEEGVQSNDTIGPKSAPAHVKSFDDCVRDQNLRSWNRDEFDDRWQQGPNEILSSTSNTTSRRTTFSHRDLLQAQIDFSGLQYNGPVQNSTTPATSSARGEEASEAIVGRGYDNLARYVAIVQSGQQCAQVRELDNLMATMLSLRGDGNVLLTFDRSGRDVVRRYMYEQIFDANDGSSLLSKEDLKGLIDVGGESMTREALHQQIMVFLEDKLEEMIRSPSPLVSSPQANFQGTPSHRPQTTPQHPATGYAAGSTGCSNDVQLSGTERQHNGTGNISADPSSLPNVPHPSHGHGSPPVHALEAFSSGQQQEASRQAWQGPGFAETSNLNSRGHNQEQPGITHSVGQGVQNFPYGPQSLSMVPQHTIGPFAQQLVGHQGGFYNPSYIPPPIAPIGIYHQGQALPQAGPMAPYGSPYVRMPQHGVPMGTAHLMQNQQMSMSPFQPRWAHGPSYMIPPAPSQWPPVPSYYGSVYESMNRAQSPLVRNSNSPFQARTGRNVVPEVALLPYRPGSDDMFPYGQQGGSVQFQELTRNGGPTYDSAIRPEILPFAENARRSKPAEWGVLRIGNIPYTLTKQEVLGFLGRNAKIINPEYGVAVHIIMDRPTGKTMDCYVEFFSQGDAQASLNKCLMRGSQLRLGERVVDVHLSSQDELLKELFPRAKNCTWEHGRPKITESTEPYNTGFKAFVTNEELLQTVTWADKPHRSNYTQKCLQRPYECMISTLAKFPWFCVDRYTIKTRDELFRATLSLVNILTNQLNRANEAYLPHISETLLIDLLYAGLNVPAFSEQQRWHLRQAGLAVGAKVRMSPLAEVWPFEVLGRKVGIDEDKYAQVLRSHPANTSKDSAFGEWTAISNEALGLQTIGQIGAHEMEMLLSMLGDVLPQSL